MNTGGSTLLFLDTEWADHTGSELVSLSLVSEDGQHRFYSELSPLPKDPTEFVRFVVYPLLEHGYSARQSADFTRDLRTFLNRFDHPHMIFDYTHDGVLLDYALDGFELPTEYVEKLGSRPDVKMTLMNSDDAVRWITRYFSDRPEQARRRHHAGVDAEALRWAYLQALKQAS